MERKHPSPETVALAGLPYSYDAEVEDPGGYPIFFRLSQAPAGMELDRSRGIVTWTPSLSQLGSHSISLIVRDAHDAETVQTWQISVQNPGDITAPQVFLNMYTDLEGNSVTYLRDRIEHSSGLRIDLTRDSQGRIIRASDPDGGHIDYSYDQRGDLVAVTDRLGQTVRYSYDDHHNLIQIQAPDGEIPAKYYYNEEGRLVAQEDAYGNLIEYDHDIEGRQEIVYDRSGNATVSLYDDWGNVISITDPLGQITRSYDAFHNITSETDPIGATHAYR